ncbi:hypothetical protein NDU88_003689 [Pleurodeles waltl]|uniref:Secreted protein n=1 Tax=Pleurodeles waltl TaxID=8319 RepID=A0AAV7TPB1_PLEWA|nr:hypothetical protein NDU88_003689 [Pleurodeles waltl]
MRWEVRLAGTGWLSALSGRLDCGASSPPPVCPWGPALQYWCVSWTQEFIFTGFCAQELKADTTRRTRELRTETTRGWSGMEAVETTTEEVQSQASPWMLC